MGVGTFTHSALVWANFFALRKGRWCHKDWRESLRAPPRPVARRKLKVTVPQNLFRTLLAGPREAAFRLVFTTGGLPVYQDESW